MDFLVEIKCKTSGLDRKVKIFAPDKARAEEWGKIQADALRLDPEKTRISATPIVEEQPAKSEDAEKKPESKPEAVKAVPEEKQKRKKKTKTE